MALRVCRICGLEANTVEELELFMAHRYSRFGHAMICKTCKLKYTRDWKNKNKDKIRSYRKKRRNKIKQKVIDLYGGQCSCCGETIIQFLTMDHIEGGGSRDRRKSKNHIDIWRSMVKEYHEDSINAKKKYRVLCFNCNCGRVLNNGICPHKGNA